MQDVAPTSCKRWFLSNHVEACVEMMCVMQVFDGSHQSPSANGSHQFSTVHMCNYAHNVSELLQLRTVVVDWSE